MMTIFNQRTIRLQWSLPLIVMIAVTVVPSESHSESSSSTHTKCEYVTLQSGHPDGILKQYCNRQIAKIMGWQGASWLDRVERQAEERTDQLLDILNLKPGMIVGDIGAGNEH